MSYAPLAHTVLASLGSHVARQPEGSHMASRFEYPLVRQDQVMKGLK